MTNPYAPVFEFWMSFWTPKRRGGWFPILALAPQYLDQAINPDWNLGTIVNINETNSSSPSIEKAVLKEASYGKQIGTILDAINVIAKERLSTAQGDFNSLTSDEKVLKIACDLWQEIENTKNEQAKIRLNELKVELKSIMKRQPKAFKALVRELERNNPPKDP
ncbi:hypothetical protein [Azospirillum rugosum]|uniref:Uncharacterized protein n=1 Tax=Azospirillum rugosum TaxID=416170 RepID=A0ABS4SLP2_9PROT|nr:hypothetical protein [Azospirillum rugosum]MBP2293149.1 hypothetical protein [Azospirillum rugosum]MDQ0526698.1 hypothetical protein [Azospirillum rugosum]